MNLMLVLILSCTEPKITLRPKAPQELGVGSSWGYPFLNDNRLHLGFGQKGDFWAAPLNSELELINPQRRKLTRVKRLTDHAFRACPDGSYLLVSSDHVSTPNYFFRFDQSLNITLQGTLPQLDPIHAANDLSVVCDQTLQGVAVAELKGDRDYFWPIDDTGYKERILLHPAPRMTGAALIEQDNKLVAIGNEIDPKMKFPAGGRLRLSVFDKNWNQDNQWLEPPDSTHNQFWPTQLIPHKDLYFLLLMSRNFKEGWIFDTGNLYIGILNGDFEPISWTQLTHYEAPGGAMRPSMVLFNNQLIVVYDKGNKLHAVRVDVE